MDPTERFTQLVSLPDDDIPLDESMFVIAAHDHPLDVDAQCARLDALAARAPDGADGIARYLFDTCEFGGNENEYTDPRNSYLDCVLDRRLGIPISLSVLMIEVARRRGVPVTGIGMPGHFLVRGPGDGAYFDPFHGGRRLDVDGARARFAQLRPGAEFHPEYLAAVGTRAILSRVLANLVHVLVARAPGSAVWSARLRLRIPGLPAAERRELASLLGSLGQHAEAGAALDALAADLEADLDAPAARRLARDATAMRARAN